LHCIAEEYLHAEKYFLAAEIPDNI